MSQTFDHQLVQSSSGPTSTSTATADLDPADLLALLDGASPETLMLAQGLTGNAFSLAMLAAASLAEGEDATLAQQGGEAELGSDAPGFGQALLADGLSTAGSWAGGMIGGAVLGLPGQVAGSVLGGAVASGLATTLGLAPGGIDGVTPATETSPTTEEPALDATPLPTKEQTREELITSYQTWLDARTAELADLSGEEKARRIEGLLDQAGRVYAQLEQGQMVDIAQLDVAPSSKGATHVAGTAPPELIGPMRALITQVEVDIEGATADEDAAAETSRTSGVDWNARLGVPQYRNQNDNVVASFVTCNVTSGAMALERLGYTRDDVKAATERALTEAWVIEQKAAWKEANGVEMPAEQMEALRAQGPSDEWVQGRIAAYFEEAEDEVEKGSNYRQMRSGKDADLTGAGNEEARKTVAGQFMDDAQMEEMLDLLMQLHNDNGGFADIAAGADLGAVRRSISVAGVADELLALIDPATAAAGTRTGCEQISGSWADAKPKIKTCLEAGGAAQMSVFHKADQSDSHLVSVQAINAGGVVIDDPYGRIGADYNHDTTTAGTSAYKSSVGGATNAVDQDTPGEVDDDWTWQQGQQLSAAELRGMSRTLPDSQISAMFKSVTLYHRPGATE